MKKSIIIILSLVLLLMGSMTAFAGKAGRGAGNCASIDILAGTPLTITGTVVSIAIPGKGLVIDTGDSIEVVYGIAPVWYWDANDIDRPVVGEAVTVDAYTVTLSESTLIIATTITVEGETIELRDAETGVPLWRSGRR